MWENQLNYLIIDSKLYKYMPQVFLTAIFEEDCNLLKSNKYYIYVDDVNYFNKIISNIKDNEYKFIIDKDIKVNNHNLLIRKMEIFNLDLQVDFKKKICKHECIYNWLFGKK